MKKKEFKMIMSYGGMVEAPYDYPEFRFDNLMSKEGLEKSVRTWKREKISRRFIDKRVVNILADL